MLHQQCSETSISMRGRIANLSIALFVAWWCSRLRPGDSSYLLTTRLTGGLGCGLRMQQERKRVPAAIALVLRCGLRAIRTVVAAYLGIAAL